MVVVFPLFVFVMVFAGGCHDQFLIGWNNIDIKITQPAQMRGDGVADGGGVFTDPAGKDKRVNAAD